MQTKKKKTTKTFVGHFFGDSDYIGDRQFLGDLFSCTKRVILLLPELQVSYGVLGNFFFTNGPWSLKTKRCISDNPLSPSYPSRKALLYYETYDTSQKSISWPISFIFLLAPCHKILSKFSIKKCVSIAIATLGNFFAKKKLPNCCDFADPQQMNQNLLKHDIVTQKSPTHAALNAKNGAFLAHLEPEK